MSLCLRTRARTPIVPVFRALIAMLLGVFTLSVPAWRCAVAAPARPQLNITGYVITADVDPATSRLTATADVTFSALEDLTSVTFELNNGLNITKLTDKAGKPLNSRSEERRVGKECRYRW